MQKRLNESSMSSAPSTPKATYSAMHTANQTLNAPPPKIPIITPPCSVEPFHSLQNVNANTQ